MATGDIKWFGQALLELGTKIHNLDTDTFKLGIVTTATVPSTATALPRWGAGGTTNFSSNQVATGTAYTGPITLATTSWDLVSSTTPTFTATDVTIAQDGSGFTNGAYGIIYNDTDASKRCIGYIELSSAGSLSIQAGSVTINFQGAGTDVLKITPA